MYCAKCGTEDNNANIYCRSCGSDLRVVRKALDSPSLVGGSTSARQEIARAFADRIRAAAPRELSKLTEEILPEIEKFLESPEERRMRRMRNGAILSFIGIGAFVGFLLAAVFTGQEGIGFLAACGIVVFFIGLSFVFNGYYLSVPESERREEDRERAGKKDLRGTAAGEEGLLMPAGARDEFAGSVTEGTTRHLDFQETGDGSQKS